MKYFKKGSNSWISSAAKKDDGQDWVYIYHCDSTSFSNKIRDAATKTIEAQEKSQALEVEAVAFQKAHDLPF